MTLNQVSSSVERGIFLKYLADIYIQNPKLTIKFDSIYSLLLSFYIHNVEQSILSKDSLVGVQVALNNKFRNNIKVNTLMSEDGCFWGIQNRLGNNDIEFKNILYNGIKLYISVQSDNIYKVSESLFNFMIDEDILMECKIPHIMRNDALVCRVSCYNDALKVINYVNDLNYESIIKPNPFICDCGKASITMDGRLSYNGTLARILVKYLNEKKSSNSLDCVSSNDLDKFIINIIETAKVNSYEVFVDYGVTSQEKLNDFIMILNIISDNINDNLKLEDFSNSRNINIQNCDKEYSSLDENKILYVINKLDSCGNYSVGDIHKIIMTFIETENYSLFPRKDANGDNVRAVIFDYSSDDIRNIISNLGWKALIAASSDTYHKYGEEQLFGALKKLFADNDIGLFTNQYDSRSRLSLVIPPLLLKSEIVRRLQDNGKSISTISLMEVVMEEVEKTIDKKNNGRK